MSVCSQTIVCDVTKSIYISANRHSAVSNTTINVGLSVDRIEPGEKKCIVLHISTWRSIKCKRNCLCHICLMPGHWHIETFQIFREINQ